MIKIKDKEYKLKYTLRALFIYEQITNKTFELKTIMDEYLFLYCILAANNEDLDLTFDNLIDICDEDFSIMVAFKEFISTEFTKQAMFIKEKNSEADKKKR